MYEFSDYLAHHGIINMKWGHKNGPPYPLAPSAHSAAEKRAKNQNAGELESWGGRKVSIGSSKEAKDNKLNAWRANERVNLDRKYDRKIEKKTRKLEKLRWKYRANLRDSGSGNAKRDERRRGEVEAREKEIERYKRSKWIEDEAIRRMTLEDAERDRRDRINSAMTPKSVHDAATQAIAELNSTYNISDAAVSSRARFLRDRGVDVDKEYDRQQKQKRDEQRKAGIQQAMKNAKDNDRYDIDFLEMMPYRTTKAERIREYSRYLKDPEQYAQESGSSEWRKRFKDQTQW